MNSYLIVNAFLSLQAALCNGKPTIVDFYAPWCESCREVAPAMRAIERRYAGSLNVVTLDGTDPKNGTRFVSLCRLISVCMLK